jgi:hypothetical protein
LISGWISEDEHPSLPVPGAWSSIILPDAAGELVTHFLPSAKICNDVTTIRLLVARQIEFGEKIWDVVDNASYFITDAFQGYAETTPIDTCYHPRD